MNKFNPNKPVQTRDGRKVRILCTDLEGDYPIAAQVTHHNGCRQLCGFKADGKYSGIYSSELDLVNVQQEMTVEMWINIYPNGNFSAYSDKGFADLANGRFACRKVVLTVKEGDGL